jgi:hypothetical protein
MAVSAWVFRDPKTHLDKIINYYFIAIIFLVSLKVL